MAYNTHFLATTRPSEYSFRETDNIALCGEDSFIHQFTTDIEKVECTKCSAKWGSDAIKKLNSKITFVKSDKEVSRCYRSAYDLLIDGECYGFVTMDTGKRAPWVLRPNSGYRPEKDIPYKTDPTRSYSTPIIKGRKSKEHAALDIFDHMELFPSKTDYDAKQTAQQALYAERMTRYEDRRREENDGYTRSIETMTEMRNRPTATNEEIDALEIAIKAVKYMLDLNSK